MYVSKFKFLFFNLFFLSFTNISFCQTFEYLVIEKPGTKQRFTYLPGEEIKLKVKGESVWLSGSIDVLLDSSMMVSNHAIRLKDIDKISVKRRGAIMPLVNEFSTKLPVASVGYLIIAGSSNALNNKDPLLNKTNLVTIGSLAGSGLLLGLFTNGIVTEAKGFNIKIVRIDLSN